MNPSSDGRFSPPNRERALEEKGQSHPDANVDETVDVAGFVGFLHQVKNSVDAVFENGDEDLIG
jgi:hypothetical protein